MSFDTKMVIAKMAFAKLVNVMILNSYHAVRMELVSMSQMIHHIVVLVIIHAVIISIA